MPGYVAKELHKLQHPQPKQPQHASYDWAIPEYGSIVQYAQTKQGLPTFHPSGFNKSDPSWAPFCTTLDHFILP